MEIIVKDITKPKLTVTPTRVTLKIPIKCNDFWYKKILRLSEIIEKEFKPEYSYRGHFTEYGIVLRSGPYKEIYTFNN